MKQLKCADAFPEDVVGCVYMIKEETDDEVIDRMSVHVGMIHSDVMDKMTPEYGAGWKDKAREKITTA